jgi:hypothetical protein
MKHKAFKIPTPVLPDGFMWGRDISGESVHDEAIFAGPDGRAETALGFLENDFQKTRFVYAVSVGFENPEKRKSYSFLKLRQGQLYQSSFLSDNQPYKILDGFRIRLPHNAFNGFGAFSNDGLDETLTRHFFGATFDELENFLIIFFSAVHFPITAESRLARITSSNNYNSCELTGAFIPKRFPYIVFDNQGYVSLSGFYTQLASLCSRHGAFTEALVAQGADRELILRLCDAGRWGNNPLRI